MVHRVVYAQTAHDDLHAIFEWIADSADAATAFDYVERIRSLCDGFGSYPNRGSPRDDLAPGVRTTVFERKAVIAYLVQTDQVRILRVLHRGRDLGRAFTS